MSFDITIMGENPDETHVWSRHATPIVGIRAWGMKHIYLQGIGVRGRVLENAGFAGLRPETMDKLAAAWLQERGWVVIEPELLPALEGVGAA